MAFSKYSGYIIGYVPHLKGLIGSLVGPEAHGHDTTGKKVIILGKVAEETPFIKKNLKFTKFD